jgi:hypothetical protein
MNDQRELSNMLCQLGSEAPVVWSELSALGLGLPSEIARTILLNSVSSPAEADHLMRYWIEYAKEKLSDVAGHAYILKGTHLSPYSYRSGFLETLRETRKKSMAGPGRPSPDLEPTLAKYANCPGGEGSISKTLNDEARKTAAQLASRLNLPEDEQFRGYGEAKRYRLLRERLAEELGSTGFTSASRKKDEIILKYPLFGGKYSFVLVDNSLKMVQLCRLNAEFRIVNPGEETDDFDWPKLPLASFFPSDVVPFFGYSCGFEMGSYSQFLLACDTLASLAKLIVARLEKIREKFEASR